MRKIFYSGAFKALLAALLLFSSIAACIYGFLTLRAPLLYQNAASVTETRQYSELFVKYVERTAVYVRYLEDGYSMHYTEYSPELELLLEGDKIDQELENYLLNVYEPSETAFYYYSNKLNNSPTNYRYYVKNQKTGTEYYPADFEEYAVKKSGSIDAFLSSGILSEPMYLIMNTTNSRTMTGGGDEHVLTRSNLLWSMDFLRRPLSDMAAETEFGYNYQVNPEITAIPNSQAPNESSSDHLNAEMDYLHAVASNDEEALYDADDIILGSPADKGNGSDFSEDNSYSITESKSDTASSENLTTNLLNKANDSSYLLYAFVDDTLAEDEFTELQKSFSTAKQDYTYGINYTLFYLILTVLLFCLCHIVSGRRVNTDTIVLRVQDHLFSEITLLFLCGLAALPFIFYKQLYVFFRDFVSYYPKHTELLPAMFAALGVYLLLIGFFYFSLVRRAKAKVLIKSSFIGRFLLLPISKIVLSSIRNLREFFHHLSMLWKTMLYLLFGGLWAVVSLTLFTRARAAGIILLILGAFFLSYLFIRNALDHRRIVESTQKMSQGNLAARIETTSMLASNKMLSEDINHICDGLHSAVEEQTKSERMKTELITNVSHDIKTPLTSIINFIELLKNELPEEGPQKQYAEILSQKSWRLKALIDDLVEASKASSGTIHLDPICFNFSELIKQAVGDFEERLTEKGLTLCMSLPEEPVDILADGACTHRIIENLLSNVGKYALKGTRVFVTLDLPVDTGLALLTIKNVSSVVLTKTSEELLTRFSRGDDSRSDEGSGLGLSIAESLAKLQGGAFYVEIDGDMFKAKLTVPLAKK